MSRLSRTLVLALLLVLPLAFAQQATAFIYWTGPNAAATGGEISRANLDGSGVNSGFIQTGAFGPDAIAVNARHLYWSNLTVPQGFRDAGSIAVANIDGSGVSEHLGLTDGVPGGVAVHGAYVYWTESGGIWRRKIRGGRVRGLIAGPHKGHTYDPFSPIWLAFDRKHIYWADGVGRIGGAKLNGSRVNYSLVGSVDAGGGIAMAGGHLYWLSASGRIGRANRNGSGANPGFISTGISPGDVTPCGLAAYGGQIYWISSTSTGTPGTIGRAGLDGSNVTPALITVDFGCGLAIDGRGA